MICPPTLYDSLQTYAKRTASGELATSTGWLMVGKYKQKQHKQWTPHKYFSKVSKQNSIVESHASYCIYQLYRYNITLSCKFGERVWRAYCLRCGPPSLFQNCNFHSVFSLQHLNNNKLTPSSFLVGLLLFTSLSQACPGNHQLCK